MVLALNEDGPTPPVALPPRSDRWRGVPRGTKRRGAVALPQLISGVPDLRLLRALVRRGGQRRMVPRASQPWRHANAMDGMIRVK